MWSGYSAKMTTIVPIFVCIVADVFCLPNRTLFPLCIACRMMSGLRFSATYRLVACSVNTMGFSAKMTHTKAVGILGIKAYVQCTYCRLFHDHCRIKVERVRGLTQISRAGRAAAVTAVGFVPTRKKLSGIESSRICDNPMLPAKVSVTRRGQTTIPAGFRRRYGIEVGSIL